MKHHITECLPEQEEVALAFTGTKLGTKFKIKDKTSKEHQYGLTYSETYPDPNCNEEYHGETGRQLIVFKHWDGSSNSNYWWLSCFKSRLSTEKV